MACRLAVSSQEPALSATATVVIVSGTAATSSGAVRARMVQATGDGWASDRGLLPEIAAGAGPVASSMRTRLSAVRGMPQRSCSRIASSELLNAAQGSPLCRRCEASVAGPDAARTCYWPIAATTTTNIAVSSGISA
jgi:hypothetical protein